MWDNVRAREALVNMSVYDAFKVRTTQNRLGFLDRFREVIKPTNYPGPFYYPSTGRVYTQVIKNVHKFVKEIISYYYCFKLRSECYTSAKRAQIFRDFIWKLWRFLEDPLKAGPMDATAYSEIINLMKELRETPPKHGTRRHQ
jgi:hypothetical protein